MQSIPVKFPQYHAPLGGNKHSPLPRAQQLHRYYDIHYRYVLNLLQYVGCQIEYVAFDYFRLLSPTKFEMEFNNALILFDFSDFSHDLEQNIAINDYQAIFKFHYDSRTTQQYANVYPFSPVNFHDWALYDQLLTTPKQTHASILFNQSPYRLKLKHYLKMLPYFLKNSHIDYAFYQQIHPKALRNYMKSLLATYAHPIDMSITDQTHYFQKALNALVSVLVPGERLDMLDRAQAQLMLLGCCTLSPRINTLLSYHQPLIADTHYLRLADDFSDIHERLDDCLGQPDYCEYIGHNAQTLFQATSTPTKQVEWLLQCIQQNA